MQDNLVDATLSKSKNLNDSVWQAKRNRQQTEKELEMLLNRLNLLKKEEMLTHKKIMDTRKQTQAVIDTKKLHNEMNQNKLISKNRDDQKIEEFKMRNRQVRLSQAENRQSIRDALKQLKKEQHDEMKKISEQSQKSIQSYKDNQLKHNQHMHRHVQTVIQQSKSNINLFWQTKITRIYSENESQRLEHLNAQTKNELMLNKLEEEEMTLIERLQRSQEIQENLGKRLERAINLPREEFKKLYSDDQDLIFEKPTIIKQPTLRKNQNNTMSLNTLRQENSSLHDEVVPKSWLPKPEEVSNGFLLEEKPVQNDIGVGADDEQENKSFEKQTKENGENQ